MSDIQAEAAAEPFSVTPETTTVTTTTFTVTTTGALTADQAAALHETLGQALAAAGFPVGA